MANNLSYRVGGGNEFVSRNQRLVNRFISRGSVISCDTTYTGQQRLELHGMHHMMGPVFQ